MQPTPESGERATYAGAKHREDSKVHIGVDTLGYLLTLYVTPAEEQERSHVEQLPQAV